MSKYPLDKLSDKERKYFVDDMKTMLRDSQPRKFLWFVLELCGMYEIPGMGLNPYDAGFINGQHNVFLKLLALLEEIDPTLYPLLLLEKAQQAKLNPPPVAAEGEGTADV